MLIVSPSYKRAGKVQIREWLPDVTLAVHEFEAAEYKKKNGGNIMILPDSLKGNMAKVRQFILETVEVGEWITMMDDDIKEVGYFGSPTGQPSQVALDTEGFYELLEHGNSLANELQTGIWGLNVQSDPKFYREFNPFSLSSPVLGTFCVLKRTKGIDYDARLGLNEDYDIYLQYLRKYRKTLRMNRYYYQGDHLNLAGGCGDYRVIDEERRQAEVMQGKWGKQIVKYNFDKSTNPRLYPPIPGI